MVRDLFPKHDNAAAVDEPALAIVATMLIGVTLMALMHRDPLTMPLLSIALVTAGFAAARVQAVRRRTTRLASGHLRVPGLVVFFGFAAAMLGDPDLAVRRL